MVEVHAFRAFHPKRVHMALAAAQCFPSWGKGGGVSSCLGAGGADVEEAYDEAAELYGAGGLAW